MCTKLQYKKILFCSKNNNTFLSNKYTKIHKINSHQIILQVLTKILFKKLTNSNMLKKIRNYLTMAYKISTCI